MNPTVEQLLQAALKLPDEEQLQLVSAFTAAVEEAGLRPFDDSWLEEIRRRSAEYDAGSVQAIPWAEVKDRIRQLGRVGRDTRSSITGQPTTRR